MDNFKRLFNKNLVNLFFLDTTSYISTKNNSKLQQNISVLFENERKHLQKQLDIGRQKRFRVDLCTKDNISKKILESFSRIQILNE